jgi:hypothetical protein
MNFEDISRARDIDLLDRLDSAGPRAHQHHPVGQGDRFNQIVGDEDNGLFSRRLEL